MSADISRLVTRLELALIDLPVFHQDAVEQAIKVLREVDWQPIASAPKDGRFLILGKPGFVTEGYRNERDEHVANDIGKPITPFTHWQPLPKPPAIDTKETTP